MKIYAIRKGRKKLYSIAVEKLPPLEWFSGCDKEGLFLVNKSLNGVKIYRLNSDFKGRALFKRHFCPNHWGR